MSRIPIAVFATACALQAQGVNVSFIGQACFYIQSTDGSATVVTDPPVASVGYSLPATPANAVTISHNHTDHNFAEGVKGPASVVDGRPVTARTEVTAAGLQFVQIAGFHDNTNGSARGRNTMVRWTQAGLNLVHMGDYGQDQFTAEQLADLKNVDVLFVPAGGFFTVDPKAMAAQVAQIAPKVAILMHYRTALGGPAQLAQQPAVAAAFGAVQYKPSSVTLSRASLPAMPEVWLMEPVADLAAVNPGGFSAGVPVGAGSVVSLFGSFSGSKTAAYSSFPLPRKLEDTDVLVDGAAAPLLFVSPGQINLQAPSKPPAQTLVEVRVGGQRVARGVMNVLKAAPGVLLALNQDGRINSASAAARRGQVLELYATGLGDSAPVVDDGAPGPALPPAVAVDMPSVTVGGVAATAYYAALAPGLVGVWRVDFVLPANSPTGDAVPVVLRQGLPSNAVNVAIQ